MAKQKFVGEYPINASRKMLFPYLSTATGLCEWFADDVHIRNNVYTFFWDGSQQEARLVKKKDNLFVRFKWLDNEEADIFFEFLIQVDDLTNDVSLIITDFAEDEDEKEENTLLWDTQVENLKHALGS